MKAIITRKVAVAADIFMFELTDPKGEPLPAFEAGAHIDINAGGFTRQYSLCNSPTNSSLYRIGVLRDPVSRGGSIAVHQLSEGATVDISEPKNHFPLVSDAKHSILLAGGIGITPILCMAEELLRAGASFELHYCVRDPDRAAFVDRLSASDLAPHSQIYYDTEPEEHRIDLAELLGRPDVHQHLYVCGPGGFIKAVLDSASANNWCTQNVHREYFGAGAPTDGVDGAFRVVLSSSGEVIEVGPSQTVVEALRERGVEVPVSCEQGACGTCLTRVLDGVPDHRDVYLTDEERAGNNLFLPCCSRSKSPILVLNL